ELKARYHSINIMVLITIFGFLFAIVDNLLTHKFITGVIIDFGIIAMFVTTALLLRFSKAYLEPITTFIALGFLIIFSLLVVTTPPASLNHVWLFTYPALVFFYKGDKSWLVWVGALILALYLLTLQPFIPVQYSLRDITYLSVVLSITTIVIYFYKSRIDLSSAIIRTQKDQLAKLTRELENKVLAKTEELRKLNTELEERVVIKATQLIEKDAVIYAQSRQAAMGEMISMIAHQWRQPLSTITLQISNIKIKAMLGKATLEETNDALEHISETIIYLSETIDDFQSFFRLNKEKEELNLCELLERGINFTESRIKSANIELQYLCDREQTIMVYTNDFAQVIINIINNGVDVLLQRKVEKPAIKIDAIIKEESVEIHISDNGGGIDEEILHKVFEPYFSTKGKNGTGLGLYMSKMIIEEKMNGNLQVRNSAAGAEFIIEIPKI
ncbi:MAG: ATP-binding protein, partial [Thiovulaceae bacterium]|nr:ATP-binding protein [Sulfurimonadaceae bacterium]